jgi:predicted metal-dependent HD superfamily phosphohydrolase
LVLATRHESVALDPDSQVIEDVDLSILGAEPARFDQYEEQVRQEYGWVAGPIYQHKRKAILESFLARAAIYNTSRFIERYERQARANLARALARL